MDGAPCFFSGSLTLGGCGLPSTDRLADCFVAGVCLACTVTYWLQ
jgi:hypothetical protein